MLSKSIQLSKLHTQNHFRDYRRFFVSVHSNSKIYTISMLLDHVTVKETMKMTINQLNRIYQLNLSQDLQQYQMYGAQKCGKKKSDLPALLKDQIISKIGINRFALCPLWLNSKQDSQGEHLTLKSIQTIFFNKRLAKQLRLKDLNCQKIGCLCFY